MYELSWPEFEHAYGLWAQEHLMKNSVNFKRTTHMYWVKMSNQEYHVRDKFVLGLIYAVYSKNNMAAVSMAAI